ncbi:MAG: hypothetical protein GY746_07530, partial [Gammaproteobacteria bacterium]|nr:hypothetical protein [Gammaproteobacteria bacterium]
DDIENTVALKKEDHQNLINIKSLAVEAHDRFVKYEMDVDTGAPYDHRDFMRRLKKHLGISRLTTGQGPKIMSENNQETTPEKGAGKIPLERLVSHFEVGKYYKHPGGGVMHIVGSAKTTLYGWALIAEEHGSANLKPVGQGTGYADNWTETTEQHWLSGFSG